MTSSTLETFCQKHFRVYHELADSANKKNKTFEVDSW